MTAALYTRPEMAFDLRVGDTIIVAGRPSTVIGLRYFDVDGVEVAGFAHAWTVHAAVRQAERGRRDARGETLVQRWDGEVWRVVACPTYRRAVAS